LNGPSGKDVFEILVREHADMLTAYLRSLLWSDQGLDDVFQEVMLVAWRRLPEYDRTRPFGAWLRGIGRNMVLEHHRKGRARAAVTDPVILDGVESRFQALLSAGGSAPDWGGGGQFRSRAERMLDCLQRLPDILRETVEMVYARGMLLRQIAESVGVNEETAKKRLQRARESLSKCVLGQTPEEGVS